MSNRWLWVIGALVIVLWVIWFSTARAQTVCGPRDKVLAFHEKKYQESQVGVGVASGSVVEFLLATDGSWTLIRTLPNGLSCYLATGTDWETTGEPKPPGKES